MFLNSLRDRMRDRIWGKAETDDGDATEAQDTFDEIVEHEKDGSAKISLKDRIRGRLWGKRQKKEDDITESEDTHSVQLENDDNDFSKPTKGGSSHKSLGNQKRKRSGGKKSAKENDGPVPKDILTIQEENDKGEGADLPQDDVDSLLQPAGEITKPDDKGSGESKGECADEKEEPDLLADIFKQEAEESDSPLEILIASLPDVEINELIDEATEVKALIRQWHQNMMSK